MTRPLGHTTIFDIKKYIDPNFKHKYWHFRVVGLTCESCEKKIPMYLHGDWLHCSCGARSTVDFKTTSPLERLNLRLNNKPLPEYPNFTKGKKIKYDKPMQFKKLDFDVMKKLI